MDTPRQELPMIRACGFLGVAVCLWVAATATSRAAVLEEGAVMVTPSTIEVGTTATNNPGDGTLRITPPSAVMSNNLNVGRGVAGRRTQGRVFVDGAALNITNNATIGESTSGLLQITLGGTFDAGRVIVGGSQSSTLQQAEGTIIVDGPGSRMRTGNGLTIGELGLGEMYLSAGAEVSTFTQQTSSAPAIIGNRLGSVGNVFLEGDNTLWQHAGEIVVGNLGTGSLHVTEGGNVVSNGATVGDSTEGPTGGVLGTAEIDGLGSRWSTVFLTIGERAFGEVRVTDGGLLNVTGQQSQFPTTLGKQTGSFGRLIISGPDSRWVDSSKGPIVGDMGTGELWIEDGALVSNAGATIGRSSSGDGLAHVRGEHTRWQAATMTVGGDGREGGQGRGALEISDGAAVATSGVGAPLTINPVGRVSLDRGTLAGTLQQTFSNNGLLEGDGSVNVGTFVNRANARILVGAGQHLAFSSTLNNDPTGRVELMNGELEVGRAFSNAVQGTVLAENATLRVRGSDGFLNKGATLLMGANRVYGKVNNTGVLAVATDSQATFYNDVRNEGSLKASAGATVRFLGALQGDGVEGPGMVHLDGAVQPGLSPGTMNFGGDLSFGSLSSLRIEIAGTTPGALFDEVNVSGIATLDGHLTLTALAELTSPTTLTILHAGELLGSFNSVPDLGQSLGFGVTFNGITYDYAQDAVRVSLLPSMTADFNLDNCVDGNDFLQWQRQLGATADPAGSGADANGDGVIDGADLASWMSAHTAPPAQAAVPEPGALVLLLAAFGCCAFRVRGLGFRL